MTAVFDIVNHCILTWTTILPYFIPIRFETTELWPYYKMVGLVHLCPIWILCCFQWLFYNVPIVLEVLSVTVCHYRYQSQIVTTTRVTNRRCHW